MQLKETSKTAVPEAALMKGLKERK